MWAGAGTGEREGEEGNANDYSGLGPPTQEMLADWRYHVVCVKHCRTSKGKQA